MNAFDWYELQGEGLGNKFLLDIELLRSAD